MASTRPQTDIVIMQENPHTDGEDIVVGDIHGNLDCLDAILATIRPQDRLFLVGDLTDRGNNSPGVIERLRNTPNVYSIRGNHENLCLDAMTGLEKLAQQAASLGNESPDQILTFINEKRKQNQAIKLHRKNGGDWLLDLFQAELMSGKINVNQTITYSDDSQIKQIKDYMQNLPYIIHVEGNKPFNIVHADMPMGNKELRSRVKNNQGLTTTEKVYATWAKEYKPDAKEPTEMIYNYGRNLHECILTIVGHSIIGKLFVRAVRPDTNTCNIDAGAFETNVSLALNMTKGTCYYVGPGINELQANPLLIQAKEDINKQLEVYNKLSLFIAEMRNCRDFTQFHEVLFRYESMPFPPGITGEPTQHFTYDELFSLADNCDVTEESITQLMQEARDNATAPTPTLEQQSAAYDADQSVYPSRETLFVTPDNAPHKRKHDADEEQGASQALKRGKQE